MRVIEKFGVTESTLNTVISGNHSRSESLVWSGM